MKKTVLIVLIIIFTILFTWTGIFYWKNLRGIGPALKPAIEDAAKNNDSLKNILNLPSGFSISIFADNLIDPRVMVFDQDKNILVSIPSEGKVMLIPNKANNKINKPITLISNLNQPHGLVFYCKQDCKLYVAETNSVSVYDYNLQNLTATNHKKLFDLPGGGNHFTRTLLITDIGGTDRLLISIGSDCNVCNEADEQRAKILSANLDGSDLKTFSSGLRNSVFMAINPISKQIWATEMG